MTVFVSAIWSAPRRCHGGLDPEKTRVIIWRIRISLRVREQRFRRATSPIRRDGVMVYFGFPRRRTENQAPERAIRDREIISRHIGTRYAGGNEPLSDRSAGHRNPPCAWLGT